MGDDGATADQDRQAAEKAAATMGQVLTMERTTRGSSGVTFLARHYGPDVWFDGETSANSCCDIRRQLAKFHVTVNLGGKVTPQTKLREKAFAFYLSDRETPIIGDFVSKVMKLYPMRREEYQNVLNIWNSDVEQDEQYPNFYEDWMMDLLIKQMPEFDIVGFYEWIESVDASTVFSPPSFAPPAPTLPKQGLVVVDGDFEGEIAEPDTMGVTGKGSSTAMKKRRYRPRKKESAWKGKEDKTSTSKGK